MLGARVPALLALGSPGLYLGEAERVGPEIIPNLCFILHQPLDPGQREGEGWGAALQAPWSWCGIDVQAFHNHQVAALSRCSCPEYPKLEPGV